MKKVETTTGPKESLARVFFHQDSEAAINEQINHELTMSYNYDAVSISYPLISYGEQSWEDLADAFHNITCMLASYC